MHLDRSFPLWKVASIAFLAGVAASCSASNVNNANSATGTNAATVAANAPKVVATTSVICDLTRQIAAETIALQCLGTPGQDPHVYKPTPEDRRAIESANLILYGGYQFEPSLIQLVKSTSNNAPKVAVHEVAVPKPLVAEGHSHSHAEDDHDHDHAEEKQSGKAKAPEADPHVWHDANNGAKMAEAIATRLKQVAPENAETYEQNLQTVKQRLQQLDAWIKAQVATIPAGQRKLVTTHEALSYYANAYGIPVEGALQGVTTEEKPTAARLRELVDELRAAKVPTIFAEQTVNPRLIETVAKEAKVQVSPRRLFADGLGEPGSGAETYESMLIANTQAITEGLGGKFSPFQPK
ncbi:MAG TPA: zinc ABC transporter substrate-binding protein [Leptolyngbyaceae cyanobacterium M33_DOE_097]|uniref:Metal ABC transporter substrate-binding protein n=1 Tax=Oscillatoriales cyanobacterium SpSt-418 TaxID=2282169 RepID=A0A7C3KDV3_9CYAN|nr:zinc ABC transporter substrate-binding protein [Leptolyngbyaceae cyanobacterium M33_DOE_097]